MLTARARIYDEPVPPPDPQPRSDPASGATSSPVTPAEFSWTRYRDATLAGLTPIIPLPFVDSWFERFFERRVPGAVSSSRDREIDGEVMALIQGPGKGCSDRAMGCLLAPFWMLVKLPLKLFKKVLVFLTVRSVANRLAHHWSRAYLLDHALMRGHLDDPATAATSLETMQGVLAERDEPLVQIAKELFHHSLRKLPLGRMLGRARREEEDRDLPEAERQVASRWNRIASELERLGERYERAWAGPGG